MSCAISSVSERLLLEAGCRGDEDAFRRLVEPHRPGLQAHCQRMLGSLHDAEDALQEALLRAWRGLCGFQGRSSLRSWLYRIATNASLDALARRPGRVLPLDYQPPADRDGRERGRAAATSLPGQLHPDEILRAAEAEPAARYEQREAVELALAAALHLPPRQRSVLVLREALGFSATEVAQALETTVASVNSALQRARTALDERPPENGPQTTARLLADERLRATAQTFVDAFERGDVDAIVSLLRTEAAAQ